MATRVIPKPWGTSCGGCSVNQKLPIIMPTFQRAHKDLKELLDTLIDKYHPDLRENDVHIDLLWAYGDRDDNDELKNNAITHNGYPAAGLTKIMPLKDRVAGRGDVEILLDHDQWEALNPRSQAALLDHELEHITLTNERDDSGRPKLKLKKHDYQLGWFKEVAMRHGDHSMERIQARTAWSESGQAFWPDLCEAKQVAA